MVLRVFLVLFLISFISSCAGRDVVGYLDDHPEFSPLVSRAGKTEYQIIWSRSWKPIIYLKAHLVQNAFGEYSKAFVSYAISEGSVSSLKQIEISMEEWAFIEATVENSPIWNYDSKCDQLSYSERATYLPEGDGCTEIVMTDGAIITISISEPGRQIGLSTICHDLGPCKPFEDIPAAILKTIGKADLAN
ncbi:hypothetical protein [Microbulbifer sp. TRSA005]|uniref:hypothetical protein n=1 Tax=Microbulbifer sp. TRSA005 TaxID=3243383 RepID=UPI0040390B03